jgi:hypothetical protein
MFSRQRIDLSLVTVFFSAVLVIGQCLSCSPGKEEKYMVMAQPAVIGPTAFFAAAGINPDWKISLHINTDSTFHMKLTLPGMQEPYTGRVIPFTTFPAGSDRLNDIYSGTVILNSDTTELLIRIRPDQCGGEPFSELPNAGCELIAGPDTLAGCGRWLIKQEQ